MTPEILKVGRSASELDTVMGKNAAIISDPKTSDADRERAWEEYGKVQEERAEGRKHPLVNALRNLRR